MGKAKRPGLGVAGTEIVELGSFSSYLTLQRKLWIQLGGDDTHLGRARGQLDARLCPERLVFGEATRPVPTR